MQIEPPSALPGDAGHNSKQNPPHLATAPAAGPPSPAHTPAETPGFQPAGLWRYLRLSRSNRLGFLMAANRRTATGCFRRLIGHGLSALSAALPAIVAVPCLAHVLPLLGCLVASPSGFHRLLTARLPTRIATIAMPPKATATQHENPGAPITNNLNEFHRNADGTDGPPEASIAATGEYSPRPPRESGVDVSGLSFHSPTSDSVVGIQASRLKSGRLVYTDSAPPQLRPATLQGDPLSTGIGGSTSGRR